MFQFENYVESLKVKLGEDFWMPNHWWRIHNAQCKPQEVKTAPKIYLPECYVLIEPLIIPGEKGYKVGKSNILETIDLTDPTEENEAIKNENGVHMDKFVIKKLGSNLKNKIF